MFTRTGGVWTEQQELTSSDGANRDSFGRSVTLDGDTVVVGAPSYDLVTPDDEGDNQGSAYVFTRAGNTWTEQQKLTAADANDGDSFGGHVALRGSHLLVGAIGDDLGSNENQGSVYLFRQTGGGWSQQQQLTGSDGVAGDYFGGGLALTDTYALIGAPNDDINGNEHQGSAYVFAFPALQLSAAAYAVTEGDGTVEVSVTREGGATGAVSATLSTSDGTATAGADYTATAQIVSFAAGETAPKTVAIPIVSDAVAEGTETLSVALSGPTGEVGLGAPATAQVTISDAGAASTLQLSTATVPVSETSSSAQVFVTRGQRDRRRRRHRCHEQWHGDRRHGLYDDDAGRALRGRRHDSEGGCDSDPPRHGGGGARDADGDPDAADRRRDAGHADRGAGDDRQRRPLDAGAASDRAPHDRARVGTRAGVQRVRCWAPRSGQSAGPGGRVPGRRGGGAVPRRRADSAAPGGTASFTQLVQSVPGIPTLLQEQQKLTASDGGQLDLFGASQVGLSGDTALVGAQGDRVYDDPPGTAYIYTRSGTTWTEKRLRANVSVPNSGFGYGVALDGDTAVIGARYEGRGAVYVFTRTGGTWTQQQRLVLSERGPGSVGQQVVVSGDTILVRAYDRPSQGTGGRVYVFTRTDTIWTETQELVASGGDAGSSFGNSIAVQGDTAVVGASRRHYGPAPDYRGAAYVFTRTAGVWSQQQRLLASDGGYGDSFGTSVAIDGDVVLVGASSDDLIAIDDPATPGNEGDHRGSAYIFTRIGTTWTEQQKLTASDGGVSDAFGGAVAVRGARAVIGALGDDVGAHENQGAAYLFTPAGGVWTEREKLVATDGAANDWFGGGLGLTDTHVLVAAHADDINGNERQGSAYVFAFPALQLSAHTYAVTEGDGTVEVSVTREGGATGAVSATLSTSDGTATAGADYTATTQVVSFAAGETTPRTVTIPIVSDTVTEGTETLAVTLSGPTGGIVLGAPASAQVTISDAVAASTLQLNTATVPVSETTTSALVLVTRAGGASGVVGATVTTTDGTAIAGTDYTATTQVVSFGYGDTTPKVVAIAIGHDTIVEADETFTVTLTLPTGGATVGTPAAAEVTIVNDDVSTPGPIRIAHLDANSSGWARGQSFDVADPGPHGSGNPPSPGDLMLVESIEVRFLQNSTAPPAPPVLYLYDHLPTLAELDAGTGRLAVSTAKTGTSGWVTYAFGCRALAPGTTYYWLLPTGGGDPLNAKLHYDNRNRYASGDLITSGLAEATAREAMARDDTARDATFALRGTVINPALPAAGPGTVESSACHQLAPSPTSSANPVGSGGTTSLSAAAADSVGHVGTSYQWTAACALPTNGTFLPSATVREPTWTAPANTTGALRSCTLQVTATSDVTGTASFTQMVSSVPVGHEFTDSPVIAGVTLLRVVHITELRARIAQLRTRCGLTAFPFTDPVFVTGSTTVKGVHVTDLQTALAEAYTACGSAAPISLDASFGVRGTIIRAADINELRAAVIAIEQLP